MKNQNESNTQLFVTDKRNKNRKQQFSDINILMLLDN